MPLYARALETRRKQPLFMDPRAVEIVDSIDWDFQRIAQPRRMAGCVLRGALFDVKRKLAARFSWACEDPMAIQGWGIGLQLLESRTVADVPADLWPRLALPLRASLWFFGRFLPKLMNLYRLNLLVAG